MSAGHTFLFEEGVWEADGTYTDEEGSSVKARGRTEVRHEEERWTNEGEITVLTDPPTTLENRYAFPRPRREAVNLPWASENPSLGRLTGAFVVEERILLSSYRNEDGTVTGVEALVKIEADHYESAGALFRQGRRMGSWRFVLRRQ